MPHQSNATPGTDGFTLIELLIVIAIVSLLMGLVGPLAVRNVEKAEAKVEAMTLNRWMEDLSYKAFLSERAIEVSFDGGLVQARYQDESDSFQSERFETVEFKQQRVVLNRNGFPMSAQVTYQVNDEQQQLKLTQYDVTS